MYQNVYFDANSPLVVETDNQPPARSAKDPKQRQIESLQFIHARRLADHYWELRNDEKSNELGTPS